MKTGLATA